MLFPAAVAATGTLPSREVARNIPGDRERCEATDELIVVKSALILTFKAVISPRKYMAERWAKSGRSRGRAIDPPEPSKARVVTAPTVSHCLIGALRHLLIPISPYVMCERLGAQVSDRIW